MPDIRTPDQRLRVFVSSTLGELAPERRAVSRAISTLRLTPVLFEAGARPHLPSDLYRAYLAQSDIFIGLYWQRYGELPPGQEISGLEEEFQLSRGMPRLLYLKVPAPNREPRLDELISQLQTEASYRLFHTPTELGRLVRDDLAQLLSERFSMTAADPLPTLVGSGRLPAPLPTPATPLLGRDGAADAVARLLAGEGRRLVTLTGPGGIGKTRLAVAVAERLRDRYRAGTVFVPLAGVTDPRAVIPRIGWALGADLGSTSAPLTALAELLGQNRWLLVLDNFEHLLPAGPEVAELLACTPGVAALVTSTAVLGVRAEHVYPVPPLPVPDPRQDSELEDPRDNPAMAMFLDRARAVRPGYVPSAEDTRAIVEICRRLEGHPLAIELAAARVQLLDPTLVLRRLSRSFDTLGTGMLDLPERQRTLRATVEWSTGMLGQAEGELLEVLAVFAGGWTVEAAAHVAGLDEDRVLELTEHLAQHSLVSVEETGEGPRPGMLRPVRAFMSERLAARPDAEEIYRRHAHYYRALARSAEQSLRSARQREHAAVLAREHGNIDVAVRWHLAHDRASLPYLFGSLTPIRVLWPFLGPGDAIIGEARSWVAGLLPEADALAPSERVEFLATALVSALEAGDATAARSTGDALAPLVDAVGDPYLEAVTCLLLAWTSLLLGDLAAADRGLGTALSELRALDEPMWTALALVSSASVTAALGRLDDGVQLATEAQRLAGAFDNQWLTAVSHVVLGNLATTRGDFTEARAQLRRAFALTLTGPSAQCLCLALSGTAALVLAEGDAERAGVLAGAIERLRRRAALRVWAWMRGDDELNRAIAAAEPERFEELLAAGRRLGRQKALDLARYALDAPPGPRPSRQRVSP